ncbi:MAG: Zinc finger C3H1 domain-containing protein [Chaenotheca gracillima]|nr:MAG: Zinc finger C3H1 domain-containing protein [Chaenotheca gracillima]
MSNYPPTPSFGVSYNTPSDPWDPRSRSKAYDVHHGSLSGGGQVPSVPPSSIAASAQSQSAFDHNARSNPYNTESAPHNALPLFTRLGTSTLPPPPFPPIPIPTNGVFPQVSPKHFQPTPIIENGQSSSTSHASRGPVLSRGLNSPWDRSGQRSEHEEGELSDNGKLDRSELLEPVDEPNVSDRVDQHFGAYKAFWGARVPPFQSKDWHQDQHQSDGDPREDISGSRNGQQEDQIQIGLPTGRHPQLFHDQVQSDTMPKIAQEGPEFSALARRESSSSYQPRSPSPHPNFSRLSPRPLNGLTSSSHQGAHDSASRPSDASEIDITSTAQSYNTRGGRSVAEVRSEAKNAILNLLPYQLGFPELLAEGVDERVLTDLFVDLRLRVPVQKSAPIAPSGDPTSQDPTLALPTVSSSVPGNPILHGVDPQTKGSSINIPARPPTLEPVSAKIKVSTDQKPVSSENKPPVDPRPKKPVTKPAASVSRSSFSRSRPSGGAIERKDLIAQKIAERTAKASTNTSSERSHPTTSTKTRPEVSPSLVTKSVDTSMGNLTSKPDRRDESVMDTNPLTQSQPEQQIFEKGPIVSSSGTAAGVGKKAHHTNELLRQKMAALASGNIPSAVQTPSSRPDQPHVQSSENSQAQNIQASVVPPNPNLTLPRAIQPSAAIDETKSSNPDTPTTFFTLPGLFMTSSDPSLSEADPTGEIKSPQHDFDSEPTPAISFKRPFGKGRDEQPLVIDVSDDDTAEGNADSDIESDGGYGQKTSQETPRSSKNKSGLSIRDMPPLSNFPNGRLPWKSSGDHTPNTALLTPTQTTGGVNKVAQDDLKRKEEAIQLMQKKIAELEQRKAKLGGSRGQTPATVARQGAGLNSPMPTDSAIKSAVSAEIDRLIEDNSKTFEEDKIKLAAAQAAEANTEEEIKSVQKSQRLSEIKSNLLRSQNELEQERVKLEDIRVTKERLETSIQEAVERNQRLMEQLQEIDADHVEPPTQSLMDQEVIEGPTQIISNEQDIEVAEHGTTQRHADGEAQNDTAMTDLALPDVANEELLNFVSDRPPEAPVLHSQVEDLRSPKDGTSPKGPPDVATPEKTEGFTRERVLSLRDDVMGSPSHRVELATDTPSRSPSAMDLSPVEEDVPSSISAASEPPADQSFQKETPLLQNSSSKPSQFSASPPRNESIQENESTVPNVIQPRLPPKDISQEMIDLDQGGYESDPYEPPEPSYREQSEQMDKESPSSNSTSATGSSSFSPAPAPTPSEHRAPHQPVPDSEAALTDIVAEQNTISPRPGDEIPKVSSHPSIPSKDDRIDIGPKIKNDLHNLSSHRFEPYESPLKQFKSYRYHPEYVNSVGGGFRSLTYSNQADTVKPICQYELSGGVCNDSTCDSQHFRKMGISDDMVLVQLGSVNEGRNEEEKARYTSGLKQTLQELRSNQVKDFSIVAAEIAAYRSRFLEDTSRVLVLDSTNRT